MYNIFGCLLFSTLLLITSNDAFCGDFRHITQQDGLSSNRVFNMAKDNTGFVWFATRHGIDRYDGLHIKTYTLLDKANAVNMSGRANYLMQDRNGILWAYTNDGYIYRYDELQDRFIIMLELPDIMAGHNVFLNGLHFDHSNRLLLYGSFGLAGYDEVNDLLCPFPAFSSTDVTKVEQLPGSGLFLIGTDKHLYLFDVKKDNGQDKGEVLVSNERINSITYDTVDQTVWIGTFSGELYRYDPARSKLSNIATINLHVPVRAIQTNGNIVYLASDGMGLICLDRNTYQVESHYISTGADPSQISSNSLYDVMIDREDNLWICTYNNGVNVTNRNLPSFTFVRHINNNGQSLANNHVSAVFEDSQGDMWYGTENGISLHARRQDRWYHFLNEGTDPSSGSRGLTILAFGEDPEGGIWAGGFGVGAVRIDKKTLRIEQWLLTDNSQQSIGTDHVYAICCDPMGNVWLGGLHGKITRYNIYNKSFVRYPLEYVNTIKEHDGRLFAGTTHGLYILDRATDTFSEYAGGILARHFIVDLYFDTSNVMWIATEKGLFSYLPRKDILNSYPEVRPSYTTALYSIMQDTNSRLWFSSENGIVCYDPHNESVITLGKEDGLRTANFNARAAVRGKNGFFTYGSTNGAISFRPEDIEQAVTENKFVITDFKVGNRQVIPSSEDGILNTIIDREEEIRLKHDQNNFSFGFTNINFIDADKIRYDWKLEGYDSEWLTGNHNRIAQYTNVPYGKYVFMVCATDIRGIPIMEPRNISIEIRPPWWMTGLAKTIYMIFSVFIVWLIIGYAANRIKKRRSDEKIEFFTNTAHEIRTPISLIMGPLSQLINDEMDSQKRKEYLEMALHNTGKLNRLVTQLLDFQKSEMSAVRLNLSEQQINRFVAAKFNQFRQFAIQKKIKFEFTDLQEKYDVWFDVPKMDVIINNLLSNAIKYTPEGGMVRLWLTVGNGMWSLNVQDNGIGIPRKAQKELFKRFFRAENVVNSRETGSGIGLMLCRNLTMLHMGQIRFESEEGAGSFFSVSFPLDRKRYTTKNVRFVEPPQPSSFSEPAIPQDDRQVADAHSATLLIIDDNQEMIYLLSGVLSVDYHIHTASDGADALARMDEMSPDLIISDIMMPGMNGYELLKHLREHTGTSHIPIILLSALDERESIIEGYKSGADDYLVKPFDIQILKLKIENILQGRRVLQQRLMNSLSIPGAPSPDIPNDLDKKFIDKVLEVIDTHLDQPYFYVEDLCREMGMSRTSFYNKLKALTDQSPNDFIRIIRLNKAAELLRQNTYTVNEVADMTGFGDVKYFSKAFKKHFGISPSRYR